MRCPQCPDAHLLMTERQGVEIDYCPLCRGVWLDRGELDKLIDRASVAPAVASGRVNQQEAPDSDYRGIEGHRPRRKKSWMSEIFD